MSAQLVWRASHKSNFKWCNKGKWETFHSIYAFNKSAYLVNARIRFNYLFKKCQLHTKDANQFKGNKPTVFCAWPMHQWESKLIFYMKLEKVLLLVQNFLAEIYYYCLAKNAEQTTIYPAHFIKKNIIRELLMITISSEIDVLEEFVTSRSRLSIQTMKFLSS